MRPLLQNLLDAGLLTDENGKTRFTLTAAYPSLEVRDSVLKTGMERGAAISYDRLEEVASELAAYPGKR